MTCRNFLLAISVLGIVACGGGSSDSASEVADLDDDALGDLCEAFRSTVCSVADFAPWDACTQGCLDLCTRAGIADAMRLHCASPIIVGDVEACYDAVKNDPDNAMSICTDASRRGGCVFDVGDQLCAL